MKNTFLVLAGALAMLCAPGPFQAQAQDTVKTVSSPLPSAIAKSKTVEEEEVVITGSKKRQNLSGSGVCRLGSVYGFMGFPPPKIGDMKYYLDLWGKRYQINDTKTVIFNPDRKTARIVNLDLIMTKKDGSKVLVTEITVSRHDEGARACRPLLKPSGKEIGTEMCAQLLARDEIYGPRAGARCEDKPIELDLT